MKQKKQKSEKQFIVILLLSIAVVMIGAGFFINENQLKNIFQIVGFGLVIGVIIVALFNKNFGYKPTRMEIEEKQFGEKNKK